ncbi:MAG TPA: hypothetical protein VND40_05555 [Nitrososphaerales archaeon]|nr:hypothetical protein [Nitrososphaerales archaeon]
MRSRGAIGKATVAAIAVLVIAGAIALSAALGPTSHPSGSRVAKFASTIVVARAIEANGSLVTNVTYTLGQELLLSITVPDTTNPVSVHQVFSNRAYGELAWNVTTTHYTYVIDSGPADPADLGVNHAYAVVTFADGTTARSNNVTMTVTN